MRRLAALVAALTLAAGLLVACGETGPSGSTNVQGGANRAPQPGGQATVRPTSTVAR